MYACCNHYQSRATVIPQECAVLVTRKGFNTSIPSPSCPDHKISFEGSSCICFRGSPVILSPMLLSNSTFHNRSNTMFIVYGMRPSHKTPPPRSCMTLVHMSTVSRQTRRTTANIACRGYFPSEAHVYVFTKLQYLYTN